MARRYADNANLILKWLRDPRYTREVSSEPVRGDDTRFLPVEIVEAKPIPSTPVSQNLIDIELLSGHRMRISASFDPDALAGLIRGCRCDPGAARYAGLAGGGYDQYAEGVSIAGGGG